MNRSVKNWIVSGLAALVVGCAGDPPGIVEREVPVLVVPPSELIECPKPPPKLKRDPANTQADAAEYVGQLQRALAVCNTSNEALKKHVEDAIKARPGN